MPSPAPSHPIRTLAAAVVGLVLATSVVACGGGSSDGAGSASGTSTTTASSEPGSSTTAAGEPADSGTSPDTGAGSPELDLCAEVTADDVAAILAGAEISEAAPNPSLTTPTCQYLVDWAGTPLSVVQITWNEDGFLDALRQSNPTATDLDGVDDGVAISEDSIVVAGASGDFQVDAGVELTDGGSVATQEQLVAVAQLVEGL